MLWGLIGISRLIRAARIKKQISFSPTVCDYSWSSPWYEGEIPNCFRIHDDGSVSYLIHRETEYHAFNVPPKKIRRLVSLIRKWSIYSLPEDLPSIPILDGVGKSIKFYDHNGKVLTWITGGDSLSRKFNKLTDYIEDEIVSPYLPDDLTYYELLENEELQDVIYCGLKVSE